MSLLGKLKAELKANGRIESLKKNEIFALERAYLLDHPECAYCKRKENLSYDHIIPRTILTSFNINCSTEFWEENGQTLCVACNQKKAQFLDLQNDKTVELLQVLIANR